MTVCLLIEGIVAHVFRKLLIEIRGLWLEYSFLSNRSMLLYRMSIFQCHVQYKRNKNIF